MKNLFRLSSLLLCLLILNSLRAEQTAAELRAEAMRTLKTAASYFHDQVASHGGYVYYYSEDLQDRWGEGKASANVHFVQPPGTPTVGMAYLKAYAATGDKFYLDAARDTAAALVAGQLASGGWSQKIEVDQEKPKGKRREGNSSLDDGQTQSAMQMLMRTDEAMNFKHAEIHEAAEFALTSLLKAQFPNGAFPQVWAKPVEEHPGMKAKYPDYDWKLEGRIKSYWNYYTLNDGLAGTVAETLITANRIYRDDKYKAALAKLGDFLLLAQMPEPQPAWCQQYNYDMVPMWARKFEPPAITGWESQDVMRTLIKIATYTGEKKYLVPIPRAVEYLKSSLLPDGRVARYYELKTNKPLYMDAKYQLTYDDSAAPSHYGWKQSARLDVIEKAYEDALHDVRRTSFRSTKEMETEVRRIIRELDSQGRWVSTYNGEGLTGQPKFNPAFRYLSSEIFSRNVEFLSEYIAASKP